MIIIKADGRGEVNFGAMIANLDIAYSHDDIGFDGFGCDKGDQIQV